MISINKTFNLIDSNIWIDFLLKTKNENLLDKVFATPVFLNFIIFTETINFIQNRISFKDAFESAKLIIDHPNLFLFLPITPEDLDLAVIINQKYYISKIGFSDAVILSQAQNYGIKLLSQDQRLQIYPKVETINPFL